MIRSENAVTPLPGFTGRHHPQKAKPMNKHTLKLSFLSTLPVMTGYLFLGAGFGIILQQSGYGLPWALAMSIFIYAGSMQYVGVGLLTGGAGLAATALTTLMVNARHLFYGLSMVDAYKQAGKKKPYLIFALTDETYSLVSRPVLPDGVDRVGYCFWISLFDQCYWVLGSVVGSLLGNLPLDFTGIDFALTALFVTIFVEQWLSTKHHFPAMVGVASAVVCLIIFGADNFLIPTMILIAAILVMARKTGTEAAK